ncbi:MAG TPA: hypothetical protein VIU34_16780, partial [Steroidobacter sp.]
RLYKILYKIVRASPSPSSFNDIEADCRVALRSCDHRITDSSMGFNARLRLVAATTGAPPHDALARPAAACSDRSSTVRLGIIRRIGAWGARRCALGIAPDASLRGTDCWQIRLLPILTIGAAPSQ